MGCHNREQNHKKFEYVRLLFYQNFIVFIGCGVVQLYEDGDNK